MNPTSGTPKTLMDAIIEGAPRGIDKRDLNLIRVYVDDFYAQHFTASMVKGESAAQLWDRIKDKVRPGKNRKESA